MKQVLTHAGPNQLSKSETNALEQKSSLYQPILSPQELKAKEDARFEMLYSVLHVSKKGKHFPMLALYGNGSGRLEVPIKLVQMLGLSKKTRVAWTLVMDEDSLEMARRKGLVDQFPFLIVSVVKNAKRS